MNRFWCLIDTSKSILSYSLYHCKEKHTYLRKTEISRQKKKEAEGAKTLLLVRW